MTSYQLATVGLLFMIAGNTSDTVIGGLYAVPGAMLLLGAAITAYKETR